MTAPNGAIKFNNLTGSDTQSSGLGPAVAVYGSGASTTGASNVVTGINTAGVSSGDLLWVQSSSGRQFSIITTVDSGSQVTCDDNFDNTESGRTWAIGGKRATFDNADSRRLLINDTGNWTIGTETDQSLTSNIGSPVNAATIAGIGGRRTISCTGNFAAFTQGAGASRQFRNLKFLGSTGNTVAAIYGGWTKVVDCQFGEDGGSNNFLQGINNSSVASNSSVFRSLFFGQGSTSGIALYKQGGGGANAPQAYDCFIKDFGTGIGGVYNGGNANVARCIIANCNYGLDLTYAFVRESIFYNITNDAIKLSYASNTSDYLVNLGGQSVGGLNHWGSNVFSEVGGYAINASVASVGSLSDFGISDTQYLHNVTSGMTGIEFSSSSLSSSPFVDAANGDFNINNAAGGGAVLRSTKYTLGG